MRELKLDLEQLIYAFEDASWMTNYYLDLETGQVVMISDDTRRQLEEIYEEADDAEVEAGFDLAEVLRQSDLHEWQQQALLEAGQVEAGCGSRYIEVPTAESHEGYRDMEDFIFTVRDERLQERLWGAIRGRGAFRRFKDVLAYHPRERERWFEFQEERLRERVLDWLESEGIQPILSPLPGEDDEAASPQEPSRRARLIAEALAFVQAACQLPGVTRIALIGSLTTGEPEPKDADLLVTVAEDMDLAPLATLGRKIQGHAQSFNRGADVFLAGPKGNYLGRTCPWKRCGPGIRARCDALHCGRRPYLHDDLETIRLSRELIAAPPIELWPQVVTRVAAPEDLEQALLVPLRQTLHQPPP
jgi:predicted nucleotidyltransferase